MDSEKFNKWFNEKFDKFRLHDEEQDNGYEEWFRGVSKDGEEEKDQGFQVDEFFKDLPQDITSNFKGKVNSMKKTRD
jgi:hypothetical protein